MKEEKGNFIEGIKVLVIDDAPAMRKIVIINLKKLGFDDDHIIVAQDGAEGLKRIIKGETNFNPVRLSHAKNDWVGIVENPAK